MSDVFCPPGFCGCDTEQITRWIELRTGFRRSISRVFRASTTSFTCQWMLGSEESRRKMKKAVQLCLFMFAWLFHVFVEVSLTNASRAAPISPNPLDLGDAMPAPAPCRRNAHTVPSIRVTWYQDVHNRTNVLGSVQLKVTRNRQNNRVM